MQSLVGFGFTQNPMGLWCRLFKLTQKSKFDTHQERIKELLVIRLSVRKIAKAKY
jgi:hypothetical protein